MFYFTSQCISVKVKFVQMMISQMPRIIVHTVISVLLHYLNWTHFVLYCFFWNFISLSLYFFYLILSRYVYSVTLSILCPDSMVMCKPLLFLGCLPRRCRCIARTCTGIGYFCSCNSWAAPLERVPFYYLYLFIYLFGRRHDVI